MLKIIIEKKYEENYENPFCMKKCIHIEKKNLHKKSDTKFDDASLLILLMHCICIHYTIECRARPYEMLAVDIVVALLFSIAL